MKLDHKKFTLVFLFFLIASTSSLQASGFSSKITTLAKDILWLRLLHLAAPGTQVTSNSFYLSTSSIIDPAVELQANLNEARTKSDYQCRFPARDQWLRTHFPELTFAPPTPCHELENWLKSYSIQSLSLVYPNHSLESSLSIFSHTFLKLNSANYPLDSNLNIALGFAAELDPRDSFFKMLSLGVSGGYIGKFTVTNYYTEVNRYGEAESRDIFEYDLNFTKEEIDFLLKHVWEIQDAQFHYYFFNGNCSYHLLTLLEIARPELSLTSQFRYFTIPLTSVKVILAQKDLIKDQRWIPGKKTRQEQMIKGLSTEGASIYRHWRRQKQAMGLSTTLARANLSIEEQSIVLDLLAESTRGKSDFSQLRTEALNLRSHLPARAQTMKAPSLQEWPQHSHDAHALSIGLGHEQLGALSHIQFRYRIAVHNILDPSEGYFRTTNLEVGDFRIRYAADKGFENSSLTFFNAFLLNPWSEEEHWPTWQVNSRLLDFLSRAKWQNSGGLGLANSIGDFSLYTLVLADSYIDSKEKSGMGIFSGVSLGFIFAGSNKFKLRGNLDRLWPLQSFQEKDFWQGELSSSYSFSIRHSVQLSFVNSWRERTGLLEFLSYF